MKKELIKAYIAGIATTIVLGGAIFVGVNYIYTGGGRVSSATSSKLNKLQSYMNLYYMDDINSNDLENGVYKGFVSALGDPYSAYYTQEEYKEIIESQLGEYCGIGVAITQDPNNGTANIVTVYEGSPAEEAGIKVGDIIYKVGDEEVLGTNLDKVVTKIKGEEGTKVKITVYRNSEKKYIEMDVDRKIIDIPTVSYKMIDKENKIGYIKISTFEGKTSEQFSEALADLKGKGMKSVIFDVRSNPGGLYEMVCRILDEILPEGTLVYTMDKYDRKEEMTSDANYLDMPMVVLINGNSASASEIFAGAIQDFGAGKIIGTQSFGKGIVQQLFPFEDGSAVKLTVSKYYTPNGVNIHGTGITPDIEVEQKEDSKEDLQLNRAIEELSK